MMHEGHVYITKQVSEGRTKKTMQLCLTPVKFHSIVTSNGNGLSSTSSAMLLLGFNFCYVCCKLVSMVHLFFIFCTFLTNLSSVFFSVLISLSSPTVP